MNPQKDDLNGRGLMAIVKDLLQLPSWAIKLLKRLLCIPASMKTE